MLEVSHLKAWYGRTQALFDVSLSIDRGKILALIGTNGAGKSSTVKSILGVIRTSGKVMIDGDDVSKLSTWERVNRHRIGVVPEANSLFKAMTVRENLTVGTRLTAAQIDEAVTLFPDLESRLESDVGELSGGQRQMVALARTFIRKPDLVLLDEPCLGLAPTVADEVYRGIKSVLGADITVVLVEQSASRIQSVADEVLLINRGTSQDLIDSQDEQGMQRLESIALGEI